MANKNIFGSAARSSRNPKTDTINEAGGKAYSFSAKHALAQLVSTGTLNNVYYSTAQDQLDKILELCNEVEPKFVAQTAIYARKYGHMKDTPALLTAFLACNGHVELLNKVFPQVIDNGKMLRNYVQIVRSGKIGRKSLGSASKRLVKDFFARRDNDTIFKNSIGNDPSLADVIRLAHPTPVTQSQESLFAYLLGYEDKAKSRHLPKIVKDFENFKKEGGKVPDVPFEMLTALELGTSEWTEIARNASWAQTRMNLNTFLRHGVFSDPKMVNLVANRLRDAEQISKSKVFPYQLFAAYINANPEMPVTITNALQDAAELSLSNVPEINGKVYVFVDVSGSMESAITGSRGGGTSKMSCLHAASVIGSAILRKNPNATIIPFSDDVIKFKANPRDSMLTNAERLAKLPSGGTNCSSCLVHLNAQAAEADLLVYVSDNMSWIDNNHDLWRSGSGSTATMREFAKFQKHNPDVKMICIDLQPYASTQAPDNKSIMNIGGFSDSVFDVISRFANNELSGEHWIEQIEKTKL